MSPVAVAPAAVFAETSSAASETIIWVGNGCGGARAGGSSWTPRSLHVTPSRTNAKPSHLTPGEYARPGVLVDDVVMNRRGLVAAVQELVGVPNHLAQERRERAELDRLALHREVDAAVNERPDQRQVRLATAPAQLGQQRGQPSFVLLLQFVEVRHAARVSTGGGSERFGAL